MSTPEDGKKPRERIVFGRPPSDFLDAIERLPNEGHPLKWSDENIQHLIILNNALREIVIAIAEGLIPDLPDRMIPLDPDDIKLMEQTSFRRAELIAEASHEALERKSIWGLVYPSGDDAYMRWKINSIEPDLPDNKEDYRLVCVETLKWKEEVEFNFGILTAKELSGLAEEITRWEGK